jgi:hypothetical protein
MFYTSSRDCTHHTRFTIRRTNLSFIYRWPNHNPRAIQANNFI